MVVLNRAIVARICIRSNSSRFGQLHLHFEFHFWVGEGITCIFYSSYLCHHTIAWEMKEYMEQFSVSFVINIYT